MFGPAAVWLFDNPGDVMSGNWELSLPASLVTLLEALGYAPSDALIRESCVPALRGTNVVLLAPPSARYAIPAMAGLLGSAKPESRVLVLVPGFGIQEWADALSPLARAASLTFETALTPARATRRLRGGLQVLLTTPEVALQLCHRSALKVESLSHIVLVWPESFENQETLTQILQDANKDAQRILVPLSPAPSRDLTDRYARRGVVAGPFAAQAPARSSQPVHYAITAWNQRSAALPNVLEILDPPGAVIWAADRASADQVRAVAGDTAVVTGDAPAAELVICYDIPDPVRLAHLASAASIVLLVPPHAVPYLELVTERGKPLRLPGALETAESVAAACRARIESTMESPGMSNALLAIAPLFERHDPAQVAAALYQLWSGTAEKVEPAAPTPVPTAPATARVWVSGGKKDEVTPNDLVAAMTRELRIDRTRIGKIDVRELYCLVEVPAEDVEEVARRMNGLTIRRRRVTARVDRGAAPKRRGRGER
jgi:DbpA-like RNA binding protein